MVALARLVAHGGAVGAIVESLVLLTVVAVFVAIWLRERRAARERSGDGPARLKDDDEAPLD